MRAPLPDTLFEAPDHGRACRRLLPRLRRILAPNPSPMTGPGTNSYLVGAGRVALIDPGPPLPGHADAVLAALEEGESISHILVTHAHRDHSGLAPEMARRTGAEVLAFGSAAQGREAAGRAAPAGGGEGTDESFAPDRRLADGEVVQGGGPRGTGGVMAGEDAGWAITALHTPGHMGCHLCLAWEGHLFTGDHVMGWSSTLVSPPDGHMGDYMASLDRIGASRWSSLLPGHGPAIADPAARIRDLRAHRMMRERQVRAALGPEPLTPEAIATALYADLDPGLARAAARSTLAHLIHLEEQGLARVRPDAGGGLAFCAA